MPARDAVMLPIENSSVEELAALLARRLVARLGPARLRARRVERVTLTVSEAPGQEAAVAVEAADFGDGDAGAGSARSEPPAAGRGDTGGA